MKETGQQQSSRTTLAAIAAFTVCALLVGIVVMFNNHDDRGSVHTNLTSKTGQPSVIPAANAASLSTAQPEPTAAAVMTPGTSQSNVSTTTVTVNGQTTHVSSSDGTTSYDKTYTSGDGANVSISVHNHSSSSSSSQGDATQ